MWWSVKGASDFINYRDSVLWRVPLLKEKSDCHRIITSQTSPEITIQTTWRWHFRICYLFLSYHYIKQIKINCKKKIVIICMQFANKWIFCKFRKIRFVGKISIGFARVNPTNNECKIIHFCCLFNLPSMQM